MHMGQNNTLRLAKVFSEGMVLQQRKPLKIWGWSAPGSQVRVTLAGLTGDTVTAPDGRWEVLLPPMKAGGPYTLTAEGNTVVSVQDVLVGEVWLCSGQSNMGLPMSRVRERYGREMALSYNPWLRMLSVPENPQFGAPAQDIGGGSWQAASPDTLGGMSAVGYFFGRALYEAHRIPVGIICAAVGGTPVSAWLGYDELEGFPEKLETADTYAREGHVAHVHEKNNQRNQAWFAELDRRDPGMQGDTWFHAPDAAGDAPWEPVTLPATWTETAVGNRTGSVWFRKDFHVEPQFAGEPALLHLGRIVDSDTAYLNGVCVGRTGYQYPPRRYAVPGGVLRAGRNTMIVRVVNPASEGAFIRDKVYAVEGENFRAELSGQWGFRHGAEMPVLEETEFVQYRPTGLYNGMVAPLKGLALSGFVWYQGESDAASPGDYPEMLRRLVNGRRRDFEDPELPFLAVQLPGYGQAEAAEACSSWARMRQIQQGILEVPNTGLAVTLDCGEWNDLHPLNKKTVGQRLADLALQLQERPGASLCSGPVAAEAVYEPGGIRIIFRRGDGLMQNPQVTCVDILGDDGVLFPVNARTEGDTLWMDCGLNPLPAMVRYAWRDNPEDAGLKGSNGNPAAPFELTVTVSQRGDHE